MTWLRLDFQSTYLANVGRKKGWVKQLVRGLSRLECACEWREECGVGSVFGLAE